MHLPERTIHVEKIPMADDEKDFYESIYKMVRLVSTLELIRGFVFLLSLTPAYLNHLLRALLSLTHTLPRGRCSTTTLTSLSFFPASAR